MFNTYLAQEIARDKRNEARRVADAARRTAGKNSGYEHASKWRVGRVALALVLSVVGLALAL